VGDAGAAVSIHLAFRTAKRLQKKIDAQLLIE
jgi:hypothetical protein